MAHLHEFRPEISQEVYSFTREIFADEVTREKIRKHLSDKYDTISEADIRNVKTEMVRPDEKQDLPID